MTPDLYNNINNTIYLTIIHNYIPALYLFGFLLTLIQLVRHPKRSYVFYFVGFLLLLFQFEYTKHIVDGLKEQTINSIITANPHYTAKKWLNIIIEDLIPMFLFVLGWFSMLLGHISQQPNSPFFQEHKSS